MRETVRLGKTLNEALDAIPGAQRRVAADDVRQEREAADPVARQNDSALAALEAMTRNAARRR